MRIGLFSWESLHSISVGGIAVHVTELAAALERLGNEVHIFTRVGQNQKLYEVIDGVHYHRCPFAFSSSFIEEMKNMSSSMAHYYFETENVSGAFDIIHGHDWHVINALEQIKNSRQKKIVLTLHSNQFGRDGNNFFDGAAKSISNLEWYGTYIADKIIVCSDYMKKESRDLHKIPEDKMRIIPNGVWFNHFDGFIDPWKDAKQEIGIGPLDPMVLFVGRMTHQKGPDMLLESIPNVLRNHPNAKFVFVGEGYLKSQLENRTRELNLGHAVKFLGYASLETKSKLLKACECLIAPSRNEPFGIVVLEAWSAGKPVITTHETGAGDLIWHDVTGLKVYKNPDSISWGIKSLLSDPEKAKWMGKNGREAAEKVFNWDAIAEKTMNVYKELV